RSAIDEIDRKSERDAERDRERREHETPAFAAERATERCTRHCDARRERRHCEAAGARGVTPCAEIASARSAAAAAVREWVASSTVAPFDLAHSRSNSITCAVFSGPRLP